MRSESTPEIDTLVRHLRESGVDIHASGHGELISPPRGEGGPTAVVVIAEGDLHEYVADLAAGYGRGVDDPWWSARGLTAVHVMDYLTTTHGGGINQVSRLSLVRDDNGLHFVEERADDPGLPPVQPDPSGRPRDHPHLFAQELETLAGGLRGQGLDARADAARATIEVGTLGRGEGTHAVTVELRPDLYRQYLDEQEAEFDAIGGDPRARAWAAWWWQLAHALRYGFPRPSDDLRRLSILRSDDGQVGLFANVVGSEPDAPQYVWSAEPGTARSREP